MSARVHMNTTCERRREGRRVARALVDAESADSLCKRVCEFLPGGDGAPLL